MLARLDSHARIYFVQEKKVGAGKWGRGAAWARRGGIWRHRGLGKQAPRGVEFRHPAVPREHHVQFFLGRRCHCHPYLHPPSTGDRHNIRYDDVDPKITFWGRWVCGEIPKAPSFLALPGCFHHVMSVGEGPNPRCSHPSGSLEAWKPGSLDAGKTHNRTRHTRQTRHNPIFRLRLPPDPFIDPRHGM